MNPQHARIFAMGALAGYLVGAVVMFWAVQSHAQESIFPNENAPVILNQDQFGNTYAQQPGQAQWRFTPEGSGQYSYQQGLDHWGSVKQSGSGTSSFDNRLDGSYRYSFTPASPIPGAKELEIHGGPRKR